MGFFDKPGPLLIQGGMGDKGLPYCFALVMTGGLKNVLTLNLLSSQPVGKITESSVDCILSSIYGTSVARQLRLA